jgi:hypothetical protein
VKKKGGIAKYADGLLAVASQYDINIIYDQGCRLPNPDTAIKLGRGGSLNHNGSEADMDGVKRSQINADEHGSEIYNWCRR